MACTVTLFPLSSHSCLPMTSFLQPSKSPSLHTLWWPLSLSVGRRSFTRARQCIRGCSTEGNVTPLPPKINSQYNSQGGVGPLGPFPHWWWIANCPISGRQITTSSSSWWPWHIRKTSFHCLFSGSYIFSTLFSNVPWARNRECRCSI